MTKGDQLLRSRLAYDNAKITRDGAFASNFMPDFNLTTEFNYKGDASGTMGGKTEYIGKVEMTWPIELFGTQFNAYRAAGYAGDSAEVSYAQSIKSVEDIVSNTWIGFQLASINRANVTNQVSIAEQFLKIARLEVEKGRGQMLLVFNAQSALINARQSLQNNTSDYAVQVYNMLSQAGDLSLDKLLLASAADDDKRQKAVDEYKKRMSEAKKVGEKVKDATEKKKKAVQ
jgi:adhesin transport system outer membrane protein